MPVFLHFYILRIMNKTVEIITEVFSLLGKTCKALKDNFRVSGRKLRQDTLFGREKHRLNFELIFGTDMNANL